MSPSTGRPGGTPAGGSKATGQRPRAPSQPPRPGVRGQFGRVRSAASSLANAHIALAKAEFGVIAREAGIIAGLVVGLLALALLLVTLLYTGTWLFLGEWLFGSLGWGILHGALFTICLMVPIGFNLLGVALRTWLAALALAVLVGVLLAVLFASNILRAAALAGAGLLTPSIAIDQGLLAVILGLIVGAILFGILGAAIGARMERAGLLLLVGVVVGAMVGALLGFITFDLPGAVAIAVTLGLFAWLGFSGMLAVRAGIDPKRRFGKLQPRESINALNETRSWLGQEWQRQRSKLTSR